MSKRKCKTISFDLVDEIEILLLEFAETKGNFSRYVKRLIEKDRSGIYEVVYRDTLPLEECEGDDPIFDYSDVAVNLNEDELDGFI